MGFLAAQFLEALLVVHMWRLVENYGTAPVEGQAGYVGYFILAYFLIYELIRLIKHADYFFYFKKVTNFKQSWDAFYPDSILLKPNDDLFFFNSCFSRNLLKEARLIVFSVPTTSELNRGVKLFEF